MEYFLYIVASSIEAIANFFLILQLFRYNVRSYWKFIVATSVVFAFLSHVLRVELGLNDYFPLVTIAFFVLSVFYLLRIPLLWAAVISTISTAAIAVFQSLVLLLAAWFGFINLDNIAPTSLQVRVPQLLCAVLSIVISNYLYKRGIGFAFNFDKFYWKWENVLVLIVSSLLFLVLFITFFNNAFYTFAVISFVIFSFLLYFALRKERADLD